MRETVAESKDRQRRHGRDDHSLCGRAGTCKLGPRLATYRDVENVEFGELPSVLAAVKSSIESSDHDTECDSCNILGALALGLAASFDAGDRKVTPDIKACLTNRLDCQGRDDPVTALRARRQSQIHRELFNALGISNYPGAR